VRPQRVPTAPATTNPIPASTYVRMQDLMMALSRSRSARSVAAAVEAAGDCEAWPYLDEDVLRPSRSRKVCMTCHWFRHHPGAQCIPLLTCQLHQGLIAQGDHLLSRCQGWADDMVRQRGWAPEGG
jgi:hypothetical protein